jgi:uncharacterized protein HemX
MTLGTNHAERSRKEELKTLILMEVLEQGLGMEKMKDTQQELRHKKLAELQEDYKNLRSKNPNLWKCKCGRENYRRNFCCPRCAGLIDDEV